MRDVVLLTADSVRRDYVDSMPFVSEHEVLTGITAGHYTRPSLAALLSSRLQAALQAKVISPTLPALFRDAGYTTLGFIPSAQADPAFGFDDGFDHYENYMSGSDNVVTNRRSSIWEFFGSFGLVRQIYRRFYPMAANMDDLPSDGAVVDEAINRFNSADPPRFLWVHQMGSHRPYGTGENAVPSELDRKAEAAGGRHWFGSSHVTEEEHELICDRYRAALGRVDSRVRRLINEIDTENPIFAFSSDHGDELGEAGYYYHQGFRRRVPDSIIKVPVVIDGVDTVSEKLSLLDLPPTLVGAAGLAPPDEWQGNDIQSASTETTVTVAPWHEKATVAWQDFTRKLIARDAEVIMEEGTQTVGVERTTAPDEVRQQLENLGYTDVG